MPADLGFTQPISIRIVCVLCSSWSLTESCSEVWFGFGIWIFMEHFLTWPTPALSQVRWCFWICFGIGFWLWLWLWSFFAKQLLFVCVRACGLRVLLELHWHWHWLLALALILFCETVVVVVCLCACVRACVFAHSCLALLSYRYRYRCVLLKAAVVCSKVVAFGSLLRLLSPLVLLGRRYNAVLFGYHDIHIFMPSIVVSSANQNTKKKKKL